MDWGGFLTCLRNEVNWKDSQWITRQAPLVEEILLRASQHVDLVQERTQAILKDEALFLELAPHMAYPRILMDKFVLHMSPDDDFRIRLHRFKTKIQNGGAIEKVHYHKWHCSTVLLQGAYRERQFHVGVENVETRTAELSVTADHVLETGARNSLPAGIPHQVVNESDNEPCLTLFLRGPSILPSARIFDPDLGTFYDTFSPNEQLRVGLSHMGRLDSNFH